MISIITAVYNQLGMNQLFYESLRQYSDLPFELIIIDNNSDDGSREFFEGLGENVRVLRNDGNYSYPYCQNRGIEEARFEVLAFLNNDIVVAPHWDRHLLDAMTAHKLEVITPCGIERIESPADTKRLNRRWKRIKTLVSIFGRSKTTLSLMHRIMYRDWEAFCASRQERFQNDVIEGFVGNSVLMRRSAIDKVGKWDERIQGADFDLFMRCKLRHMEVGDIKPVHIALGIFHHHYIRLTAKTAYPPFKDRYNLLSLEEKWGQDNIERLIAGHLK